MATEQEIFEYLDELRESGITNMLGAAEYIENMFDVDRKTARTMLSNWMNTFSERHAN